MRRVLVAVAVLIFLPLVATSAQQAATGRIVGRVIDAATGAGLAAAGIQVVGTTIGTQSGVDGRFTIVGVPAGTVTLAVRRIGYAAKTVTGVLVPAGGAIEIDITMETAKAELSAVTVSASAERGSVNSALDAQRTATGIVNADHRRADQQEPGWRRREGDSRVSGVTVQDGRSVFVRGLGERYTVTNLNGAACRARSRKSASCRSTCSRRPAAVDQREQDVHARTCPATSRVPRWTSRRASSPRGAQ
jgi:hypothetical protein